MKKKQPIYLNDIHDPIVKVGTLFGQDILVRVSGRDSEERDANFVKSRDILHKVFSTDVRTSHTEKCHWTGVHTLQCYCRMETHA